MSKHQEIHTYEDMFYKFNEKMQKKISKEIIDDFPNFSL